MGVRERLKQVVRWTLRGFRPAEASSESRLMPVAQRHGAEYTADLVFVHGLDGDPVASWHPDERPDDFWPRWVAEDHPQLRVWTLGYAVSSSDWRGRAMPLTDRATNTLALLAAHGLGARPVLFISHSMGGLLAKELLRQASDFSDDPKWGAIVDQTKGIVFLSTPHTGSGIATFVEKLPAVLLRPSVSIDGLKAHDPALRSLNQWYRANAGKLGIATQVYFETQNIAGLRVVDEGSADPGMAGVVPIPMDADHITICKPSSKTALAVTVHPFVASQDPDRSAIGRSRCCGRAAGRGSAGDGRGPSGLDRGAGASRSEASAPHRRARVASEA